MHITEDPWYHRQVPQVRSQDHRSGNSAAHAIHTKSGPMTVVRGMYGMRDTRNSKVRDHSADIVVPQVESADYLESNPVPSAVPLGRVRRLPKRSRSAHIQDSHWTHQVPQVRSHDHRSGNSAAQAIHTKSGPMTFLRGMYGMRHTMSSGECGPQCQLLPPKSSPQTT